MLKVLLALVFAFPALVSAQTYKCIDKTGKTIYQDMPCYGATSGHVVSGGEDYIPPERRKSAAEQRDALLDQVEKLRDRELKKSEARQKDRQAASASNNAPSQSSLANQCVNLYRPHMKYNYVDVLGSSIDGPVYPEISVQVQTLANGDRRFWVKEKFICALEPSRTEINRQRTQGYIDDYAKGVVR